MNKLRENTGVILWILVFSFGVIWVLQDSGAIGSGGQGRQTGNIIVVDGDPITVQEYNRAVESRVRQFESRTGQNITPQMRDQLEQRTYDMLVQNQLLEHAMDRLGITVTDAELVEMVRGEDPHPLIKAYFSDGKGGVNRQLLNNFIENRTQQWIQLENALKQQRRQEKILNLIAATVRIPEQDLMTAYRRQNLTVDVRYVALPYAAVSDSAVQVTEGDLRTYYEDHREDYHRERSYAIQYVTLRKAPTAKDTTEVVHLLEALREEFKQAENDSLFLAQNASAQPYSSAYVTPAELNAPLANALFSGDVQAGEIVGPVAAGGQAHLVKVLDVQPAGETFVHARHILFKAEDEAAVQAEIEEVQQKLAQGADFAELARQYSDGPAAVRGGDLGWFGPGQMVEPFSEAAFNAAVGDVVGPVETQYGLHLIKVVGRADEKVQIADMALSLRPSVATLSNIESRLGDLAYYASQSGDFAQEAQRDGLEVQEMRVTADQTTFPGIGTSTDLTQFLETAEEGAISEVIELDDRFIVASVESITPEGYRPLEEVKAQVRARVVKEKKQAVQIQKLEQALAQHDNLGAAAQAIGAEVRTHQGITYAVRSLPVVGTDPVFVGTAMGLTKGQTSHAVAGENAAFVVKVTQVEEPDPMTDEEREQLRTRLQQQRRNQRMQQWLASLREEAEIEDHRALYLQ